MSKTDFILGMLLMAVVTGSVQIWDSTATNRDMPQSDTNISCYKWVENGNANVSCPDIVYAPNSVVNISIRECSEYQFANDEPHPCPEAAFNQTADNATKGDENVE